MKSNNDLIIKDINTFQFSDCSLAANEEFNIIYELNTFCIIKIDSQIYSKKLSEIIKIIEFHPLYLDIFAIGTHTGNISIWNIPNNLNVDEYKVLIKASDFSVLSISFNPNQKYKNYIAGAFLDKTIKIFSLSNSCCLNKISLNSSLLNIKWEINGELFGGLCVNNQIFIWNTEKQIPYYFRNSNQIIDFIFQDSTKLKILTQESIIFLDIKRKKELENKQLIQEINNYECIINNDYLFAFENKKVKILELKENKIKYELELNNYNLKQKLNYVIVNQNNFMNNIIKILNIYKGEIYLFTINFGNIIKKKK